MKITCDLDASCLNKMGSRENEVSERKRVNIGNFFRDT